MLGDQPTSSRLNSVTRLTVGMLRSGAASVMASRSALANEAENEAKTGRRERPVRGGTGRGGNWPADGEPIPLDAEDPLVVPVVSAAGGVGRSTVAAILAAALDRRTSDRRGRAVAVCDASPRSASPWPGWVDHTAERGTGWLATCAADADLFAREVSRSTSALDTEDGRPIWVLADTGALQPAFSGAHPGPQFWAPVLRYLRAAVIDGDSIEAFRLVRQQAGGELSAIGAWMAAPATRTAALWVTDPSLAGLSRTLQAVTTAEQCGLPMRQVVVAINDHRGHGWTRRARSRCTLLADRVGAIVELDHDAALLRDGRPCCSSQQLGRRDITGLMTAVIAAADRTAALPTALPVSPPAPVRTALPVTVPVGLPASPPDPAERNSRHVATSARAVPAGS